MCPKVWALGTTEPGAIRHPQTLVLPALKSPTLCSCPCLDHTAYRFSTLFTSNFIGICFSRSLSLPVLRLVFPHTCPTSCGPRLPAGSHTCSGTGWDSPGGEDGWKPHPKAMTGGGQWVS